MMRSSLRVRIVYIFFISSTMIIMVSSSAFLGPRRTRSSATVGSHSSSGFKFTSTSGSDSQLHPNPDSITKTAHNVGINIRSGARASTSITRTQLLPFRIKGFELYSVEADGGAPLSSPSYNIATTNANAPPSLEDHTITNAEANANASVNVTEKTKKNKNMESSTIGIDRTIASTSTTASSSQTLNNHSHGSYNKSISSSYQTAEEHSNNDNNKSKTNAKSLPAEPQTDISSSANVGASIHTTHSHNNNPSSPKAKNNNKKNSNNSWLEHSTKDILDTSRIPLGQLTTDDVDSISGLMASWAKRKSTYSAIQVERLLKRVVDDHNAGNDDENVRVSTRMYTMAIDAWAKTGGKQAAERACEIHRGMVDAYRRTGDKNIRPSTISYNAVINAWSKSGCDAKAAIRAEGILNEMLEEWRRERARGAECRTVEDLRYDHDEPDCMESEDIVKPDVVSFTSVIDTWAKSGNKDGAAKAMNLLKQMERLYVEEGQRGMKPNVYTYSACINAFAKSTDPSAPKKAEALLADMKSAYEAGDMDVKPNVVNYNSVINAYGRCKKPGSADRAAEILRTMESEGVEPDALSYSLVVSAWAHSPSDDATRKAEVALGAMEEWVREKNKAIDDAFDNGLSNHAIANGKFDKDGDTPSSLPAIRVHLDVECYNTVLIALSKRHEHDAPDRAIAVLKRMQKLADEGFETVRPNPKSWNSVLNTLSRACNEDSTKRAEQLLQEMNDAGVHPDVFSYAALLHAYQKNASPYAAQRADDIVRTMEQLYNDGVLSSAPDVYHYTIVCACWARSGESIAAQRCWEILQHMERRVQRGYNECRPNTRTYNAVIDSYARGYHVDEAEKLLESMIQRYRAGEKHVKPDGFTFNAVINSWTRCRRRGCGERAEMVLKKLLEFHEKDNPYVKPDSRSFSHIIDYYSRSRDPNAAKKAEWLLVGMIKMYEKGYEQVCPNIFTFASVIGTYAKSKSIDAGISAERVLHLLEDFSSKHNLHSLAPNTFVANTVLHAWSKSGNPKAGERVEEILLHMEMQYYNEGVTIMRPNTRSYGLVLSTLAKSTSTHKTKRARHILCRMRVAATSNENVLMNVHCYNAVLNAAAFTEGGLDVRTEAFNIASKTLEELLESASIEPISSSFGTYLKVCGKLSLPRHLVEPAISKAFDKCRALGLVNDFVLTQLRYSTSTAQYKTLLGDEVAGDMKVNEKITMENIPSHWRENVADRIFNSDKGEWWKSD